jgi:hypothetical protein
MFQAKSRILSFARNLGRFRQRRTKQGVRSKRGKKEEDSPVISKRPLPLPGGHRTSGGHGRTRTPASQQLSPFLSLHLGTARTSARAVPDQSLVRTSVTEPTSAQRFKGRKGSTAQCRDWAAWRRPGFPHKAQPSPEGWMAWHVMTKCG